MNNGAKGNCSIKLDRLSICYNESNQEYVQKTCGLLRDHNMPESIPRMTITKNPRYHVSCVIPVPFKEASSKAMACFEAGPRRPGQASYRLDYNPSKLSEAGFDDLSVFLETIIDPDVVGFFRASKVVAYEKPVPGSLQSHLRLECRLKPGFFGHQVAKLENPFSGVGLIPADFSETAGIDIPAQFFADSIRIGGLKRALRALDPARRKRLKQAFKAAESVLPNLDAMWALWPDTLIGMGLGKHLGAVPVVPFAKAA